MVPWAVLFPSFQDPLLTAHAVQHRRRPTGHKDGTCGKCGRSHKRGNCPAYGTKCFKCGGMNHFKQFCCTRHSSSSSKGQSPFKKRQTPAVQRQTVIWKLQRQEQGTKCQRRRRRQYTIQEEETTIQRQEESVCRDTEGKPGPFSTR